jgi:hypothetical protein
LPRYRVFTRRLSKGVNNSSLQLGILVREGDKIAGKATLKD